MLAMETDRPFPRQPILDVMTGEGRRFTWLAAKIGYAPAYLSRVFNGHLPASADLRALCSEALGRPEADLFHGAPNEPSTAGDATVIEAPNGRARTAVGTSVPAR